MLHEWRVSDVSVENENIVTQCPLSRRVHDKTLGSESVTINITTLDLADVNEILLQLGDIHL